MSLVLRDILYEAIVVQLIFINAKQTSEKEEEPPPVLSRTTGLILSLTGIPSLSSAILPKGTREQ